MATVQHTISVNVPIQTVYRHLTQFEEYFRFMQDVESVQRTDDSHLHWTTRMANRPIEWDAEITDHEPERCIAWHNISGPTQNGKVEMQPLGPDTSQITFTLHAEPQQVPGSMAGYSEQDMALRLQQDLARLKDIIESGESQQKSGIEQSSNAMQSRHAAGTQTANPVQSKQQTASPIPMRHLGQMPQDTSDDAHASVLTSDSMGKTSYTLLQEPSANTEQPPNLEEKTMQTQDRSISKQSGNALAGQPADMLDNTGAAVAGAHGGTDAAAGAQLSGSKGGPGGSSLRQQGADATGIPGSPGGVVDGDNVSPAAGADAAGGTGLGSSATADDTRTGTGTASGSGVAMTGGGMSGSRDASTSRK